jgi:hypothetical protein
MPPLLLAAPGCSGSGLSDARWRPPGSHPPEIETQACIQRTKNPTSSTYTVGSRTVGPGLLLPCGADQRQPFRGGGSAGPLDSLLLAPPGCSASELWDARWPFGDGV